MSKIKSLFVNMKIRTSLILVLLLFFIMLVKITDYLGMQKYLQQVLSHMRSVRLT